MKTELLRVNGAVERDPAIDARMKEHADGLGAIAHQWIEVIQKRGMKPGSFCMTAVRLHVWEMRPSATSPKHFRLTPFGKPLRRDVPQSAWPAVVFWADLLADDWSLLTDCVRTGKPARDVRDPKILSRWSQTHASHPVAHG
jgi:hypothetical protein